MGCVASRLPGREETTMPKREFRGVWIQTAYQSEYKDMTPAQMQADFVRKLDFLHTCGINAILFQVRPEADAFYKSELEPWSRFFTGKQGLPPDGEFDLMQFLIDECHKRNMEFHAWLNPYRAGTAGSTVFADSHIIRSHPERFVKYGNQVFFDPGQPQNRRFICRVVEDIVSRYDVDGVHLDDYFYPYPVAGISFPDDAGFNLYGLKQGYTEASRGDWRRENVNKLVREIAQTIRNTKPWVRFGISPFGIYRNKKNTPDGSGSDTNGLQNYDDLYADVLLWLKQGWIDYNIPQLYWNIGYPAADYATLVRWWNGHAYDRHLYIGQDIDRTMKANQLADKLQYPKQLTHIRGNCFWPANEILRNNKGVADSLAFHYHRYPALLPAYTHLQSRPPEEVTNLQAEHTSLGVRLHWHTATKPGKGQPPHYFVIYRFEKNRKTDLNNPAHIAGITRDTSYLLPLANLVSRYRYVVTAVDRFHNESRKGKRINLKF
ncbi:MAG: family 10 glycosylhydrolase [Tannerellaceae bacterium]|nr:family 10 glycosylhydrolase [Tannerellaceae bacterium]